MLTSGTPWKRLIIFALPLMLANMLQQFYNTVDTIIVGNFISQNALAAVGSCTYITGLYTGIAIAVTLGLGVVVSQNYGAKNTEQLKNGADTGIILSLILGLIFSIFSYFSSKYILENIISVPNEILNQAIIYMKIYSIGIFFQFGYNAFSAILRAIGNSKSTLYFLLVTTILNITLDLFFITKLHFGIAGAAIATCISQFTAFGLSYIYTIKKYPTLTPSWNYVKKLSLEILKTGIPLTIQALIVNCGFMIMQKIANSFGVEMTASYSVACRLEIYILIPIISILHAMSTFAGQNYGAKKINRLKLGVKQAVIMNLIIASFIGGISFTFAPQLVSLFALKGQAFNYSVANFRLASVDLLLYASYTPINGLCIGIGKGYVLSIISLIELVGRIFFAIILSRTLNEACVWWCEPFAWIIVIIWVYTFYMTKLQKDLKVSQ